MSSSTVPVLNPVSPVTAISASGNLPQACPNRQHQAPSDLLSWSQPTTTNQRNLVSCIPILTDFQAIFERDPAASNWLEVLLCYPGFHALVAHRLAHWLYRRNLPVLPRMISHIARWLTGIEIHPGAQIGSGVVIDHGMGVVIGETAIIGDYALIYQGVTLGGTGKETGKRHPTLGRNVVVGAGAKVLGNIHIGDFARVGAGSIVLRDVPARCTAVGVPGRNICRSNSCNAPLEHGRVPDAEAEVIRQLVDRITQLEDLVQQLKVNAAIVQIDCDQRGD